jgi:hypothetical protein
MKGCRVVGHARKKSTAQKKVKALRSRGHRARVGGSRGNYSVNDCGMQKTRRRRRRRSRR